MEKYSKYNTTHNNINIGKRTSKRGRDVVQNTTTISKSGKSSCTENGSILEPHKIEDDVVGAIELPISTRNFLHELGDSRTGQITRYEVAEMYCISVAKLDQLLSKNGGSS
jgi:hypothetical protein